MSIPKDRVKMSAIAMLNSGYDVNSIAKKLELSPSIIEEWLEELSPEQQLSQELNSMAVSKATDMLQVVDINDKSNKALLEVSIAKLALIITNEMELNMFEPDFMVTKCLNISADTLVKLSSLILSSQSTNNVNVYTDELKIFKEALRD